jgi:hypothetical protein
LRYFTRRLTRCTIGYSKKVENLRHAIAMPEYIVVVNAPGSRKFSVLNPVNLGENFAESWTEEHYQRFLIWHKRFAAVLQKVHYSKGLGLGTDEMLKNLAETFGNDRVIRAAKELGADTNALHDAGKPTKTVLLYLHDRTSCQTAAMQALEALKKQIR